MYSTGRSFPRSGRPRSHAGPAVLSGAGRFFQGSAARIAGSIPYTFTFFRRDGGIFSPGATRRMTEPSDSRHRLFEQKEERNGANV